MTCRRASWLEDSLLLERMVFRSIRACFAGMAVTTASELRRLRVLLLAGILGKTGSWTSCVAGVRARRSAYWLRWGEMRALGDARTTGCAQRSAFGSCRHVWRRNGLGFIRVDWELLLECFCCYALVVVRTGGVRGEKRAPFAASPSSSHC